MIDVVLVYVEHDDRVGQGEGGVGVGERVAVRLLPVVGKVLQDKGDQGSLAWKQQ